jgi:dTDP-glucose 4,6-dehydratase
MNIFVTGGAGFIGSCFVRMTAAKDGWKVTNFDKLTYAASLENVASVADLPNYTFVQGDICDTDAVREALPRDCDAIVHFAAESHVDRSIAGASEFIRTNVLGTQVLLDAAREKGVKRFLYVSTDEVGGSIPVPDLFSESDALSPNNPYAASKAAGEHLVRAAGHTHGMNVVITRSSNNYGPCQYKEKLIPLAITNALQDKPVPVYGDGLQQRDWIYVDDNCEAILAVLERGTSGATYHIGAEYATPNILILREVLRLLGKPVSLLTQVADRPGHDRRYAIDTGLIRQQLDWHCHYSLPMGLENTVYWYKEHAGTSV